MKPGCYQNLPMQEYLAMPAVNAGLLKTLISECPRAAWFQSWLNPKQPVSNSSDVTNAGSIAHMILLEGHQDGVMVIDPLDYPAEKTGNIPEGWTNKAIRGARDAAMGSGKIPVLKPAMAEIGAMVDSAKEFIESVKTDEPAIWELFQPGKGESELTIVFDDNDTLCKIRPDRISLDRKVIVDVKTTQRSAEPSSWGRSQLDGLGYYMSAAFYRRGVKSACGVEPSYTFLVIEQEPPFLCSLVGMGPSHFEVGAYRIAAALNQWRYCMAHNKWEGYPTRVCYPDISPWELARAEEQEEVRKFEMGEQP